MKKLNEQQTQLNKQNAWMRHPERGAQLTDSSFGLIVIVLLIVGVIAAVPSVMSSLTRIGTTSDASKIITAATNWKMARPNFNGISMNELCSRNLLPAGGNICGTNNDGVNANRYGGNWTISALPSNSGLLQLTHTMPNDADQVLNLADSLASATRSQCASATGCDTLTVSGTTITAVY